MKKLLTCIVVLVMVAALGVAFIACNPDGPEKNDYVQGVDTENHVIKVGNTAATSGAFAGVGVPFNYGQEAAFWYFENHTDGYKDAAGNSYSIEFIHYDDGFVATEGVTYTQKLVEDDEVFALVGHFGSNTVGATVEYIEEQGIPMVYGVCGVSSLYGTERNIMTVQPIYDTEGSAMVASAFASKESGMGLGATKLGVISTTDEAGIGMLRGIQLEVNKLGKGNDVTYVAVDPLATDLASPVITLKNAGCDVIIIAANQAPFSNIARAIAAANYDNVALLTSYVSANAGTMGALSTEGVITETRPAYAGAWLHTGSLPDKEYKGWNDFVEYTKVMTLYAKHKGEALLPLDDPTLGALITMYFGEYDWAQDGINVQFLNSYIMAGYVSGNVFCQGLARMSGTDLTWSKFIDAMESAPIDVPMGLTVDYANGNRIGIDALALSVYTPSVLALNPNGGIYRGITLLKDIEAAC